MNALFHSFGPGPIPSSIRQAYKAYLPLYQRHLIAQQPELTEYEKAPYIAYDTPSDRNQIILYDRKSKRVSLYLGQVFNAALDHTTTWPRTDDQKSLLRKLVSGTSITQKDKLLGRKIHRNIAQVLMTGGDDVAAKIKNLGIPCWAPNFYSPDISKLPPDEIAWLQSVFLPWELSKICGDQRKKREAPLNAFHLLDSFVQQRCVLSSELEVEARILYDAYAANCQDDMLPPMKFKDFNSALEQQYPVQRYRPHHSRESNPYYFKGISLCTDRAIEQDPLAAGIFFDRLVTIEQEISCELYRLL